MVAFIPWSLTVKHSGERAQNDNLDTEFVVDRHQLSRSLQVTRFHKLANVCPKNSCHPIV